MNILIVHNQYQLVGGEDAVAVNEGDLLKKYGNNVFYYIRNNNEISEMRLFRKVLSAFGTIFSIRAYKEINELIKQNKIDVVHVHNTVPLISPSVYYAAKRNNSVLVQSIHNMRMLCPAGTMLRDNRICEECVNKNIFCCVKHKCYRDSRIQSILLSFSILVNRMLGSYELVDSYIVTTNFNYNYLSKIIDRCKIVLRPYCLDAPIRDLNKKTRDYFIYVSRLEYMKGIQVALQAFKNMPNERLLVLGTGPDEQKSKNYVKEHNIKNIEFLGFKSLDEMRELLYNAKALIFPTQWYEGFPMTIIESMALGTPIVGSNIGNVGSIIIDGINGYRFKYDDYLDLISKIETSNFDDKLEYSTQQEYIKNHNSETIYQKTIEIYKHRRIDTNVY